jgi:hypothetical protein
MGAAIGMLLVMSWTGMIWMAFKLVQELQGALRDRRHIRQHALR